MKTVVFSIDVEPDVLPYSRGTHFGIEEGLPNLFDLLDELAIEADVFVLGSILRAYPWVVQRAASGGHCIGSHGWDHELLSRKDPARQAHEIDLATSEIERVGGKRPRIFRAPNFSISVPALRHLASEGYLVDSSVIPCRTIRRWRIRTVYDYRTAPLRPYRPSRESVIRPGDLPILEVPASTNWDRPGTPIGAGYINAFGPDRAVSTIRNYPENTVVLITHPWELVDLGAHISGLPEGYDRGCSADIGPLKRVLEQCQQDLVFSTSERVAREWMSQEEKP